MSRINRELALCSRCGATVPPGQGALRYWNGAARQYAPKYAKRSPTGILSACHCNDCEAARRRKG